MAHRGLLGTRKLLGKLRLAATDADWQYGTGSTVEGPVLELLMLAAGRTPDLTQLGGDGCALLTTG